MRKSECQLILYRLLFTILDVPDRYLGLRSTHASALYMFVFWSIIGTTDFIPAAQYRYSKNNELT